MLSLLLLAMSVSAAKQIFYPGALPDKWEPDQYGTNTCPTDGPTSNCQNVYLNSLQDFCLFGPPQPNSQIGNTEAIAISWCLASGHGTRLIPPGTITGAHFIETPSYYQITGTGDLTKLNVQRGDSGGEYDPHGATGGGNPAGGLIFSFGQSSGNILEWDQFISDGEFCLRACKPAADDYLWCRHTLDVMGCVFNQPGNYGPGFDHCKADNVAAYPGVYGASTFSQGDASTPAPQAAAATSNCQTFATLAGGAAPPAPTVPTTTSTTNSSLGFSTTSTVISSSTVATTSSTSLASLSTSTTTNSGSGNTSTITALPVTATMSPPTARSSAATIASAVQSTVPASAASQLVGVTFAAGVVGIGFVLYL